MIKMSSEMEQGRENSLSVQSEAVPVKISIVVPVYNDAEYLPICLDSLVNQTLKDIEILATDDASTDDSLRILYEYAERDSRVKVFSFPENRSAFQARNMGIRHASGEYIMFADGDDYLELDACERVWKLEQENPVDILNFGTNSVNHGEVIKNRNRYQWGLHEGFLYGSGIFFAFQEGRIYEVVWNKVFSRALCLKILSLSGDWFLPKTNDKPFIWMAAYLARSFRACPSAILYNHQYGLGIEGAKKKLRLSEFSLFLKASWAQDAIEIFMRENSAPGEYDNVIRRSRQAFIRRSVELWLTLTAEEKPLGLRMLRQHWASPGDAGEIVSAFCKFFQNDREKMAALFPR